MLCGGGSCKGDYDIFTLWTYSEFPTPDAYAAADADVGIAHFDISVGALVEVVCNEVDGKYLSTVSMTWELEVNACMLCPV